MKSRARSFGIIAAIVFACFVAGFGIGWGITTLIRNAKNPSDGEYLITVCHTTDTHGSYFSKDFNGSEIPNSLGDVSNYIKTIRDAGIEPVLIDCGDNLQGSNAAYYFNYVDTAETHVFTKMQQYIGYDAIVVGNHDIEAGHPVYDRIRKEAGVPMLASNALISEGRDAGKAYFDEYAIIKRGKVKIAVIGMTNPNIKSWLAESLWKGMDFVSISSIAQEVVDRVKEKEKPHLTILAIHSGNGDPESNIECEGIELARTLRGVDLILCGHDHRTYSKIIENENGNILLIDSGNKSNFVGRADFRITIENRKVKSVVPESYGTVDMNDYEPDPEFLAAFNPLFEEVAEFANRPICKLAQDITFETKMDGPSEYVTLIHKAQLYASGADISFAAPLTSHGGVQAGDITFNDLSKIYRFENTLYKIELTGKQIKDFLEFSYDGWINRTLAQYNMDSAYGINYIVHKNNEKGNRVEITALSDSRSFDENTRYSVAITSYRASGGGNLLSEGAGVNPSEVTILEEYEDIRSLIGEYMLQFPEGYNPENANNWKFD